MQRHAARTCELLGRAALPELLGQQPLHERGNGARRCEAVAVEEVLHQQHCAQMNSRSCQSFICGQCPVSKYTIDQVQTIHSWKLPCRTPNTKPVLQESPCIFPAKHTLSLLHIVLDARAVFLHRTLGGAVSTHRGKRQLFPWWE